MIAKVRCRTVLWFALAAPLLAAGCAKTGEPQPPRALVPRPASDLAGRQLGEQVLLTLSAPAENIDGSPASAPAEVEIFRLLEERSDPADPHEEEQFLRRADRILVILETELPAHTAGNRLVLRDPLALRDRSLLYRKRLRYAARFINRRNQTAGLSNQFLLEPVPVPGPVKGLSFQLHQDFIRVRWEPPPSTDPASAPAGFNLYRSEDPGSLPGQLRNSSPLPDPEFFDREFEFGRTYYYSVSVAVKSAGPYAESLTSEVLTVTAVDTFPPGPPENLQAVAEGNTVYLLWTAPEARDLAGYRVYRSDGAVAPGHLLQAELIDVPAYRDQAESPGADYVYGVSAVDTRGNESPRVTVRVAIR